jgi:hypothetical protein
MDSENSPRLTRIGEPGTESESAGLKHAEVEDKDARSD